AAEAPVEPDAAAEAPVVLDAAAESPVVLDAAAEAPVVLDAPVLEAPVLDAPLPDAPLPDATVLDATVLDAPLPDAPLPDAPLPDATIPLDVATSDSVIGQNDAGKYLCKGYGGTTTVVCQCNDGLDNDVDNKVDYPNDPGCIAAWDNNELDGLTQCTDGVDNDGDGKIDAADPECTGPLDNDESSFGTGIPGDNIDCQQDCFFDGNSGAGDDDCRWNIKCDPAQPAPYLPPPQKNCTYDPTLVGNPTKCPNNQSQLCLDFCLPVTPNGCDCFGCCAIPTGGDGGAVKTVMLKPTCKMGVNGLPDPTIINDPYQCPPCTQVPDCLNSCGLCEVCVGKPSPDPSCTSGLCPPGIIYCGPGGIDPNACPAGSFCITGCCIPVG
ncbi:MAG: hypothetical protein ABI333_03845, partial [bacterium]